MGKIISESWNIIVHSQIVQQYVLNPVVWGFYAIIILVYVLCMFLMGRITKDLSPEGAVRSAKISLLLGIETIHISTFLFSLYASQIELNAPNLIYYLVGSWVLIALPFFIIKWIFKLPLINLLAPYLLMLVFVPYTLGLKGRGFVKKNEPVRYLNEDE